MKRNKRKKKYRKSRGKGRSGIEGEISDNIRPEWIVSFVISNRYKQSAAIQYIGEATPLRMCPPLMI
jgi:hypothetical protein